MGNTLFEIEILCRQLVRLPRNIYRRLKLPGFRRGDIYLDCFGHPVVVTETCLVSSSRFGPWDRDLAGVSLVDGTYPRSCSVVHCAPHKVDYNFAIICKILMVERKQAEADVFQIYQQSPELKRVWG